MTRINYRTLLFLLSFLTISFYVSSCFEHAKKKNAVDLRAYPKENIIKYCKKHGIPVRNSVVVLMPATICAACNIAPADSIRSIPSAIFLHSNVEDCVALEETQECYEYENEEILSLGLLKLYPQIFVIQDDSVLGVYNWID